MGSAIDEFVGTELVAFEVLLDLVRNSSLTAGELHVAGYRLLLQNS